MVNRTYRYGQPNVAFPFGHGLSYANFTVVSSAVAAAAHSAHAGAIASAPETKAAATAAHPSSSPARPSSPATLAIAPCEKVTVRVEVTNTAAAAAAAFVADAVVQGYARWTSPQTDYPTPSLSLFDFARVPAVRPGETRAVELSVGMIGSPPLRFCVAAASCEPSLS